MVKVETPISQVVYTISARLNLRAATLALEVNRKDMEKTHEGVLKEFIVYVC